MKNLKKVLAVVLALAMLAVAYLPATVSAETTYKYAAEAKLLNDMGLYAGISSTSFVPDLGSTVTKEQGVALLLRALGYKAYALGLTETQIATMLESFTDKDQVSAWARPYMAAGISLGLVNGNPDFTLGAKEQMDSKMLAKLILVDTDYTIDASSYSSGPYILRDKGAFTYEEAAYFYSKAPLIRDDLVGMIFLSLKLKFNGTSTTLIQNLITKGLVVEALALRSGAYTNDLIALTNTAIAAFEAAPATTEANRTAALALKATADAWMAKFATIPTATTPTITAIKTAFQNRINAKLAQVTTATFDLNATNGTTLVVTFTKAIDVTTTANLLFKLGAADSVTVASLGGAAVWSNGNKTLTITYAGAPIAPGTLVEITSLTGLMAADLSCVTVASKSAYVSNTAPVIGDTISFGTTKNTMNLTLSKAIAAASFPTDSSTVDTLLDGTGDTIIVKLDGTAVTAKIIGSASVLTIIMPTDVTYADHVLYISNYKSVDGILGADKYIYFKPGYDNTAPTLNSVTVVNTMEFNFVFSEVIAAPADAAAFKAAFTVDGVAAATATISGATVVVVLPAPTDADILFGVSAAYAGAVAKDATGNVADAKSFTVTMAQDTVAPTLAYAINVTTKHITVTANESVIWKAGTALVLKDGTTTLATVTIASDTYLKVGTSLDLDFSAQTFVTGHVYSLTVGTAPVDTSVNKNAGAPLTYSFTYTITVT